MTPRAAVSPNPRAMPGARALFGRLPWGGGASPLQIPHARQSLFSRGTLRRRCQPSLPIRGRLAPPSRPRLAELWRLSGSFPPCSPVSLLLRDPPTPLSALPADLGSAGVSFPVSAPGVAAPLRCMSDNAHSCAPRLLLALVGPSARCRPQGSCAAGCEPLPEGPGQNLYLKFPERPFLAVFRKSLDLKTIDLPRFGSYRV